MAVAKVRAALEAEEKAAKRGSFATGEMVDGASKDVYVQVAMRRVFDLDTLQQQFGVQLTLTLAWKCPENEEPPNPQEDDGARGLAPYRAGSTTW